MDHPLIDHLLKGFVFAGGAQIEEELIPESTVDKVTRSVLTTAHVEVNIAPVVVSFLAYECRRVRRIHIAQIVGRTSGKAGHSAEFQGEDMDVVYLVRIYDACVLLIPSPAISVAQWGFTR